MSNYIHSGYYDIYRPPYSLSNQNHRSSIFCISNKFNTVLVLIPLTTSFFKDVVNIVKLHPSRIIYIVAPDIGVAFASDYYLTWDYITNKIHKVCKIFSKYMIENFVRSDFKADIIRTENDNLSIDVPRSDTDVSIIDITLTKNMVASSSPFSCDVIVYDGEKKRLFCGEMNTHKAVVLNNDYKLYDEIHMPYLNGNYGGLTYNQLVKDYPILASRTFCNQFSSFEEFQCARSRGVKVGGAYNDSI